MGRGGSWHFTAAGPHLFGSCIMDFLQGATQPSSKLNLREQYTIITTIFNTLVTTFLSNLDTSKTLISFQFLSTATLI